MGFFNLNTDETGEHSTVIDTHVGQRLTLTFSVEGLSARDELLFKGYVRLLDHLTDQAWQYHEASTQYRVDVLVANEHVLPTRASQLCTVPQPVLLLGSINLSRSLFFLTWPLKPHELENLLNQLGGLVCKSVSSGSGTVQSTLHTTTALAPLVEIRESRAQPLVTVYTLRQWPRPMLLVEPGRMRLATLLRAKAMDMQELVFRSALPKSVCERFVSDMQTAGLLTQPDSAGSQHSAQATLAGVQSVQLVVRAQQVSGSAAKAPVSAGLIARIRMRFGIKMPSVR